MKGSTLHRSGLTREKMGVLASFTQQLDRKQAAKAQINQYYGITKAKEIDLLWNSAQKSIQKVHNVAKTTPKSPAIYLLIGFISGVLFMCAIVLIVSLFSMNPKTSNIDSKRNVTVITEDNTSDIMSVISNTQEKYVVKKGDTLNGIAYRFYGKYEPEKILEIQKINNISNPQAIRIGQELIIPVMQER